MLKAAFVVSVIMGWIDLEGKRPGQGARGKNYLTKEELNFAKQWLLAHSNEDEDGDVAAVASRIFNEVFSRLESYDK
jgi:hypothetical protein